MNGIEKVNNMNGIEKVNNLMGDNISVDNYIIPHIRVPERVFIP